MRSRRLLFAVLSLLLAACVKHRAEMTVPELVGRYQATFGGTAEWLELRADGSYLHSMAAHRGRVQQGRWKPAHLHDSTFLDLTQFEPTWPGNAGQAGSVSWSPLVQSRDGVVQIVVSAGDGYFYVKDNGVALKE
jgi:hypothetical protein